MNLSQQNLLVQKRIAALSIILFLIKITAWYFTHSVAILTDALESIVNVVAGLLGIYSLHLSAKPKDIDHPYGHGKVEFITTAVEGTLVFVAGILIIYGAMVSLLHPTIVHRVDFGILLLGITAIINYAAGYFCESVGHKNNSLPLIAGGKHLKTDTYTTVGIIVGMIILYFTKIVWLDSAVAILFACIISYTGYKIIRSAIAGIMDEADIDLLKKMIATLNKHRAANWIDIHNMRIIKYGALLHLDAHLTVPWYFNVIEAHKEIDDLKDLLSRNYDNAVEIFIHSDACADFSCGICIKSDCNKRKHDNIKIINWTFENISTNEKHSLKTR